MMTADIALTAMSNPDVAAFMSANEIDFQRLRTHKTVLYVMVRQQDLSLFSFALNLFYSQLFRHLLSERNYSQYKPDCQCPLRPEETP